MNRAQFCQHANSLSPKVYDAPVNQSVLVLVTTYSTTKYTILFWHSNRFMHACDYFPLPGSSGIELRPTMLLLLLLKPHMHYTQSTVVGT